MQQLNQRQQIYLQLCEKTFLRKNNFSFQKTKFLTKCCIKTAYLLCQMFTLHMSHKQDQGVSYITFSYDGLKLGLPWVSYVCL